MVQRKSGSRSRDTDNEDEANPAGPRAEDVARIEGYLEGRRASFEEIEGWIRMEIRRDYGRLRDEHDDLGQSVHGKLLQSLRAERFEGRSSLRRYVSAIAQRVCIDRLRELYQDRFVDDPEVVERAPGNSNPYLPLEAMDERRQMHQVLLTLPASCRELWRLVFVQKLSYEEVGRQLSIPPGTVKSRMWHCRQKAMSVLKRVRMLQGRGPQGAGRA